MPVVEHCDYCKEHLSLTECKMPYDTYLMLCPKHCEEMGFCRCCGYRFDGRLVIKEDTCCKSCRQMQKEALEKHGWID